MKDILNNKTLPRGTIYKDVVIIGKFILCLFLEFGLCKVIHIEVLKLWKKFNKKFKCWLVMHG